MTRLTVEASRLIWLKTSFWWLIKLVARLPRLPIIVLHDDSYTSLVYSLPDYCNFLLLNLPSTQTIRLQLVLNSAARAVTKTPKFYHITPILKSHHHQIIIVISLKKEFRIKFFLSQNTQLKSTCISPLACLSKPYAFNSLFFSWHSKSSFKSSHLQITKWSFYYTAHALIMIYLPPDFVS